MNTPHSARGFASLLLIIVIVALAAGGYWYYKTQMPATSPASSAVTQEWKMYRNNQYGFEFSYPAILAPIALPGDTSAQFSLYGEGTSSENHIFTSVETLAQFNKEHLPENEIADSPCSVSTTTVAVASGQNVVVTVGKNCRPQTAGEGKYNEFDASIPLASGEILEFSAQASQTPTDYTGAMFSALKSLKIDNAPSVSAATSTPATTANGTLSAVRLVRSVKPATVPTDIAPYVEETGSVSVSIVPYDESSLTFEIQAEVPDGYPSLDKYAVSFDAQSGFITLHGPSGNAIESTLLRLYKLDANPNQDDIKEALYQKLTADASPTEAKDIRANCIPQLWEDGGITYYDLEYNGKTPETTAYSICGNSPSFILGNLLVENDGHPIDATEPKVIDNGTITFTNQSL